MIVVISCAGSKHIKPFSQMGSLKKTNGSPVAFVALSMAGDYAHPDDPSGYGMSWREKLLSYNRNSYEANPDNLLPAWKLYKNAIYERLVNEQGEANVYILSAGWGLIRSDFLTPYYDITFSSKADKWKMRKKNDKSFRDYNSLCEHSEDLNGPIVFFGGLDYVSLFCKLTDFLDCRKVVFYRSKKRPKAPGYELLRFNTTLRMNWHYQCANDFIAGKLPI